MTVPTEPSPDPLVNFALISFGMYDVLLIILVLLLLAASALFAGSEVAFFSISHSEREQLKKSDARKAKIAEKLLDQPKELLATILIAKNFLNVSFVVITALLLTKVFVFWNIHIIATYILVIVIITLCLVFVGESFPKTVAFSNKAAYVKFMSPFINFFSILPPFSFLKIPLSKSSGILERRAKRKGIKLTKDALETVLTLTESASESTNEYNILQGVLKFGNTEVRQIMCPRIDVVAVDAAMPLEEVMDIVIEAGYSRLPVYKESRDNIIGVLFIKDLLPFLAKKTFDWTTLIREPFFIPENKKIDELLKEFQSKKVHLAIVVDEYGGSSGLVTLEDVIEEIVGEITDELDEEEVQHTQINDRTYTFEGKTPLQEFYRITGVNPKSYEHLEEDVETIGGLVMQTVGKIPKEGEEILIENLKFTIEETEHNRIHRIKVELIN